MPDKTPDLSVVMVSYNTRDITRSCLQSITDGTRELSYELWVVDNNSTDGSVEMIERDFPAVRLIRNQENRGVAAATNQGLQGAAGRYLLSMNSDVLVPPGCLAKLVRFMDQHPEAGGLTPRLVLQGGGEHPRFFGNQPSCASDFLFALCLFHKKFADWSNYLLFRGCDDYSTTRAVPCVHWGTFFMVRREVLDTVGPQDPRYFIFCEDLDWSIRIGNAGWKLYYLADIEVVHLLNQSTKKGGSRTYALMWQSRCRMIGKHHGTLAGLTFRVLVALACSLKAALIVARGLVLPRHRADLQERIELLSRVFKAVISY